MERQQTAMPIVSNQTANAAAPHVMCSFCDTPEPKVARSHSTPATNPSAANIDNTARPIERAAMVANTSESVATTTHSTLQRRPTPTAMAKTPAVATVAGTLNAAAHLPNPDPTVRTRKVRSPVAATPPRYHPDSSAKGALRRPNAMSARDIR